MPFTEPSAPPMIKDEADIATQLTQLKALHFQGDLSDSEYSSAKAIVLGQHGNGSNTNTAPLPAPPPPHLSPSRGYPFPAGNYNTPQQPQEVEVEMGGNTALASFQTATAFAEEEKQAKLQRTRFVFPREIQSDFQNRAEVRNREEQSEFNTKALFWKGSRIFGLLVAVGVLVVALYSLHLIVTVPNSENSPSTPSSTMKITKKYARAFATNKTQQMICDGTYSTCVAAKTTQHMICNASSSNCDCKLMKSSSNSDKPTVCACTGDYANCDCGGADLCYCSGRSSKCALQNATLLRCSGEYSKCPVPGKLKEGQQVFDLTFVGFLWFCVAASSAYLLVCFWLLLVWTLLKYESVEL
jgi:hypothetical protein